MTTEAGTRRRPARQGLRPGRWLGLVLALLGAVLAASQATAQSLKSSPFPPPGGTVSQGTTVWQAPAPTPVAQAVESAETPPTTMTTVNSVKQAGADGTPQPIFDPAVKPAACTSCRNGLLGSMLEPPALNGIPPEPTGCGTGQCVPGQQKCCKDCPNCAAETFVGRVFCEFYNCMCCPDNCYEPHWFPLVDSCFFIDSARPITQIRLRQDNGWGLENPDRAEYFWARLNTNPNQIGPANPGARTGGQGKGPDFIPSKVDYQSIKLYVEGAVGRFSVFTEVPYLHYDNNTAAISTRFKPKPPRTRVPSTDLINTPIGPGTPLPRDIRVGAGGAFLSPVPGTIGSTPTDNRQFAPGTLLKAGTTFPGTLIIGPGAVDEPALPDPVGFDREDAFGNDQAGWGDIQVGFKSVLMDCELCLMTLQFKTYIPTGNFTKGLGNSHVSLEPSLLWALKLTPVTYLQGQCAYWIPVGGDDLYQGNVFHWHVGVNQQLWKPTPSITFVGTLEFHNWFVLNGMTTSSDFLVANPAAVTDPNQPQPPVAAVAIPAEATMVSVGPGLRMFICDYFDFGVGAAFNLTGEHWEEAVLRTELRWRF